MVKGENAKGVNLRQNATGAITCGFHVATLIEYLQTLTPNANGYVNFLILQNFKPSSKGGYTHRMVRNVYEPKPIEIIQELEESIQDLQQQRDQIKVELKHGS